MERTVRGKGVKTNFSFIVAALAASACAGCAVTEPVAVISKGQLNGGVMRWNNYRVAQRWLFLASQMARCPVEETTMR